MKVSVSECGDGMGIRLPNKVTETLELDIHDQLKIEVINDQIVLSIIENEITIEEMFKGYEDGLFQSDIQNFESTGNEKW